jgi:hypothetical protein
MKYEKQLFTDIEKLLPRLEELQKSGTVDFTNAPEDVPLIGEVIKKLIQGIQPSLSCSTCIIHYLNTMLSFYEREYPIFQKSQMKEEFIVEEKPVGKNHKRKKRVNE